MDQVERAVAFHGHLCPGVITGVRAAQIALRELGGRAEDEELVAIVECDNCAVDAIQELTGCTFGKGNLIYRDYGKTAFTFVRRSDGKAIRVASKPRRAEPPSEEYLALREKINADTATEAERDRFGQLHRERAMRLLELPEEEVFTVREVDTPLPRRAQLRQSVVCSRCGEPVMETRARLLEGEVLCLPCFGELESR
ncbi:MAG: formylmethanofuran dehydrogenase [Anaerolineae bacterium]|nr:formylmethanofuran dehydrogenase [Anaerolineae bacterium]